MALNNNLNNGTVPLTPAFGGTGVANTGTFTVGGNTAFSGAFTFAGTITGNTAVTFPTSGTLATTSGASGIVNSGTANQIAYYASSGTTVSGLTGANGSVLVTDNTGVPSMLANPAAAGRVFQSANAAIPVWSTSSYADTYAVSTILYAGSANTVSGLATTNRASLSTNSTGVPTWLALTDGQLVIGSSAGSPAAASLTAGTGISITPGSNSISIAATGSSGMAWANIAGTTQAAAVNTGYVVGNASQTTITLPTTAALGSVVAIQGKGAAGWILAAGAGQTIQVGQTATSTAGSVTSAAAFDAIQVVCITANTTWSTSYVLSSGVAVA
jgi:hypothetical protein